MIRVLVFIAILAAIALGAGWLADRPGDVAVVWQGYRIETSVMVALSALAAVFVVLMIIWAVLRFVLHVPNFLSLASRSRRRNKGFASLSRGMIAVGAGDPVAARRYAADAERLLGQEPLTLLLSAQAAQIGGDRAGAEAAFNTMLDSPETRVLGLRGLFVEARRKGDQVAARAHAARAVQLAPGVGWANEAVLEYYSAEKNWRGALATLERRAATRQTDKDTARRQRAVLLTADALDRADSDPAGALQAAQEAVKYAPDLVPAAAIVGRLLSRQGSLRKATKVLETSWKAQPHPDLAAAYIDLRPGDSALDRLERARTLLKLTPGNPEAQLALAYTAMSAREYATARKALAPLLLDRPSVRVCLLMAEIEEAENAADGAVREWLARASRAPRDPAWIADGVISDHWEPISPVTGHLDAYTWTTPTELIARSVDLDDADDVLLDGDEAHHKPFTPVTLEPPPAPTAKAPAQPAPAQPAAAEKVSAQKAPLPAERPSPVATAPTSQPALPAGKADVLKPETVGTEANGAVSAAPPKAPPGATDDKTQPISQPMPKPAAADAAKTNPVSHPQASSPRPLASAGASPVIFPVAHAPDDPGPAGDGHSSEASPRSRLFG